MKKISLKNLNLKEVDQLSREQLKNVLGGNIGGTGTDETTTGGPSTTEDDKPCSGPCEKKVDGVLRSGTYQRKTDGTCICAVAY
jgi:natural product precursor